MITLNCFQNSNPSTTPLTLISIISSSISHHDFYSNNTKLIWLNTNLQFENKDTLSWKFLPLTSSFPKVQHLAWSSLARVHFFSSPLFSSSHVSASFCSDFLFLYLYHQSRLLIIIIIIPPPLNTTYSLFPPLILLLLFLTSHLKYLLFHSSFYYFPSHKISITTKTLFFSTMAYYFQVKYLITTIIIKILFI